MTRQLCLSATAALALLAGCQPDTVPPVEDPAHIIVDGQPVTPALFLHTYCQGKTDHPTCTKVQRAMVTGAARSPSGPQRF